VLDAKEPVSKPFSPTVAKFKVAELVAISTARVESKHRNAGMLIVVLLAHVGAEPRMLSPRAKALLLNDVAVMAVLLLSVGFPVKVGFPL
jgi:hypothetical protein